MGVLTVNIDHIFTQITQNLGRDGTAIYISTGTAIFIDYPPEHEFTVMMDTLFLKDSVDILVIIDFKNSGDFRAVT